MARKKKNKRIGLAVLAVILILVAAGGFTARAVFGPSVEAGDKGIAVYVPTGTTPEGLAELLRPHLRHTFLLGKMTEYANIHKKSFSHSFIRLWKKLTN